MRVVVEAELLTDVDSPELFHGIEGHDFLEQIVPVVALRMVSIGTIVKLTRIALSPFRWEAW